MGNCGAIADNARCPDCRRPFLAGYGPPGVGGVQRLDVVPTATGGNDVHSERPGKLLERGRV